jgi:deoxyadenosine/deoxycytidine kinase
MPSLLENPKALSLMVEGNIGAGKSTFLRIMEQQFNATLVPEPLERWQNIEGNNLLDYFYKETRRWAYSFQAYALVTRIAYNRGGKPAHGASITFLERSIYSDRYCFAKNCFELGFMDALEWDLYKEWFVWIDHHYAPIPDAFIYLRADPEVCHQRLLKRNRAEEASVSLDYLKLVHQKHEDWLIHKKEISSSLEHVPVLVLACDEDFEHNKYIQESHVRAIVNFLNQQVHPLAHVRTLPLRITE